MLDICLLGTGGMQPLPYRWLTSMMARCDGSNLLIDCGEGTQVALKEKDYTSQTFLQWYLTEQVEEEADSSEIVEKLKAVQGAPQALLMLDRELGQRG